MDSKIILAYDWGNNYINKEEYQWSPQTGQDFEMEDWKRKGVHDGSNMYSKE